MVAFLFWRTDLLDTMFSLKNLTHLYHNELGTEIRALDRVDLEIGPGQFVAIIGRNGSGKSTLARHLNALLLPADGDCLVRGMNTREHKHLWDIRQMVGMVFQNPDNQIVAAVVEEDIAFGPENLGIAPALIRSRVAEALRLVGMEDYRFHGPHLLSGGQKQRVAIAGVLAMECNCMVLDEPTAMLDPVGRREVLEAVCRLHRDQGITVVYITHFMEEAIRADRIIVMDGGRIALEGTPAAVFSQTEKIRSLGLDVPASAEISRLLREQGVELPTGIVTDEQLVDSLCR